MGRLPSGTQVSELWGCNRGQHVNSVYELALITAVLFKVTICDL